MRRVEGNPGELRRGQAVGGLAEAHGSLAPDNQDLGQVPRLLGRVGKADAALIVLVAAQINEGVGSYR